MVRPAPNYEPALSLAPAPAQHPKPALPRTTPRTAPRTAQLRSHFALEALPPNCTRWVIIAVSSSTAPTSRVSTPWVTAKT